MEGISSPTALLAASNRFAFRFLAESLRGDSLGNVMVSPLGLVGDFALLLNGASSAVQADIRSVMEWQDLSLAEINQGSLEMRTLLRDFPKRFQADSLVVARSLWIVQPERFDDRFRQAANEFHDVELQSLESTNHEAVAEVNGWVSRKTEGVLKHVVSSIDGAGFLLLDATYFEGSWQDPFEYFNTCTGQFRKASGQTIRLPFMRTRREFSYLRESDFQAVCLQTSHAAMSVILPDEGVPICDLEERFTFENWANWQRSFKENSGILELPSFRASYRAEVSSVLSTMGLGTLLTDPETLRPAVENPSGAFLSSVLQAVSLDVDENGVKVASAGAMMAFCSSEMPSRSELFHMVVDRPFVFVIHDTQTQTILYLGVVKDPESLFPSFERPTSTHKESL